MRFKRTLILVFIILSVVAVWDVTRSGPEGFVAILDESFLRIEVKRKPVPVREPDFTGRGNLEALTGIRQVVIDGFSGDLEVVPSETGEATASYSVFVWGETGARRLAETAASLTRQLAVGWVREGETARLTVERPQQLPAEVTALRVAVRLALPEGVELDARHTGYARIEGVTGPVRLGHSAGEVLVQHVSGPVEITSSSAGVAVENIAGPVHVDLMGGDLRVRHVAGPVTGRVQLGGFDLEGVSGDVTFTVDQGAARIAGVGGDARLTGSYGEMQVSGVAGDVTAHQSFGALRVRGVTRAADISVRFGDVQVFLQGEGGWTVEAVAELGSMDTDLPLHRETSERRTVVSGIIGDGAHDVRIEVHQGAGRLARQ